MDDVDASLQSLVAHIGRTIHAASDAATVIASLRCMASLLHDNSDVLTDGSTGGTDAESLAVLKDLDEISKLCREKALQAFPKTSPDSVLSVAFYHGPCFAAFAQLLLHNVSLDWLACFSLKDQTILFDNIFTHSPPTESLRFLGHGLSLEQISDADEGYSALYTPRAQAERLLALILISRQGVKELSVSFSLPAKVIPEAGADRRVPSANYAQHHQELAQLLSSIPDRISLQAPSELRSPVYVQAVVSQLIESAEKIRINCAAKGNSLKELSDSAVFKFTGQVLMGLCRRGHAGVIASQMVPSLMQHLLIAAREYGVELSETRHVSSLKMILENLQLSIWSSLIASITDSYALERFSEALIREIATRADVTNVQAYCALHALYGKDIEARATTRNLFTEKLIFEKVLPIRCLKWILHVAIFRCPPITVQESLQLRSGESKLYNDMVRRLAEAWAIKEFIQVASPQRQAYLTAALGICLGKISKEALESTDGLVARLLEGISNRLDSPLSPIRQMAKRIALVFSTVVDPGRPLLIDEDDSFEDLLNWEGLDQQLASRTLAVADVKAANAEVESEEHGYRNGKLQKELNDERRQGVSNDGDVDDENQRRKKRELRKAKKEQLALEEDDPDAIVRLGDYSFASDDSVQSSETDSDHDAPLLQPYDMSDDEEDTGREKIAFQLSELAINLRNSEKPDAVEEALKVAERLFLARPVELVNMAADLALTLVHVKSSGVAVEGEEDIVEERRYKALVALLSCCPLQTAPVLTMQLFSQHIDTSQRILILDVMAAGARVLASGNQENESSGKDRRGLLTSVAAQTNHTPWYEPEEGVGPTGAGSWVEVPSELPGGSLVGWANKYERELPRRPGQRPLGRSRRWGNRALQLREEKGKKIPMEQSYRNEFVPLAPAFMLPVMRDYDKKWPHLDLLGRDFLVLGKILSMLGVCMECISMQHQTIVLATGVLEMLRSREIGRHPENFVRRTALFAVSRVLTALHPSDVLAAFSSETPSIVAHLEWVREWALEIAMGDPDSDCSTWPQRGEDL